MMKWCADVGDAVHADQFSVANAILTVAGTA